MASIKHRPLVVVLGPTASGKSAVGMALARHYNGEIICADSRTVYIGMDIGTAKASLAERAEIPHHLVDVITPDQVYTAAMFKEQALLTIDDCHSRGVLPIVVGGTGLYIDALIFDFSFRDKQSADERLFLDSLDTELLQNRVRQLGIAMPENFMNRRHLIRAIETNGSVSVKKGLKKNTLVIGMDVDRATTQQRVINRLAKMEQDGLESEVSKLASHYSWQDPGMTAVGYREWQDYFNKQLTTQQTFEQIAVHTMQYAKRQRTWFRRNDHIKWVKNNEQADELVQNFLESTIN